MGKLDQYLSWLHFLLNIAEIEAMLTNLVCLRTEEESEMID